MNAALAAHLPKAVAFTLVAASLAVASAGRIERFRVGTPPVSTELAERDLLFVDQPDGGVAVREAASGRLIETFEGENGFLRGTLRGFARTRHLQNVTAGPPFRLTRWSDGRLTLDDPATGRHVELLAFGPDNAGVFAHILYAQEASR